MPTVRLTARFCESAKAVAGKQLAFPDAGLKGLEFRVSGDGRKTWSYRYRTKAGRQARLKLGVFWDDFDLEKARKEAVKIRVAVDDGGDPAQAQRLGQASRQGRADPVLRRSGAVLFHRHRERALPRQWPHQARLESRQRAQGLCPPHQAGPRQMPARGPEPPGDQGRPAAHAGAGRHLPGQQGPGDHPPDADLCGRRPGAAGLQSDRGAGVGRGGAAAHAGLYRRSAEGDLVGHSPSRALEDPRGRRGKAARWRAGLRRAALAASPASRRRRYALG